MALKRRASLLRSIAGILALSLWCIPSRAETPFTGLLPAEAATAVSLPPEFSIALFAGEPDVKQPVAFAIDDSGRLWVVENYSYPKRQPEGKGQDRILIFKDTNGDGKFDHRAVFIDNLNMATAIEIGFGGVWVGAAPYLLFIPCEPGGEKPSGPPEIVLDGFGYQDTHNTLSTFTWGPDGWLYGGHGIASRSRVGRPGTPDQERRKLDGSVWRYHPTRREFEVFAEGLTNPWGLDFNERGHLFATGCVIPHLWHIVQGGRYQRLFGEPSSPYTYGEIPTIADHRHWVGENSHAGREGYRDEKGELRIFAEDFSAGGGHAHAGGMIYLGGSWPEKYRGKIFMNNLHGHRLNMDVLERSGSGYIGKHGPDFLLMRDQWSLILNLQYGPDGSVYMIDFYEKNLCHFPDPSRYDRSNGRIYKIGCKADRESRVPENLQTLTDVELVELQLHQNEWFARHARRILQERTALRGLDKRVEEALRKIFDEDPEISRKLRALWALHVTGGTTEKQLLSYLRHPAEHVRAWVVQLLCENKKPPATAVEEFTHIARQDSSPLVRLYLAAALQRLDLRLRLPILQELSSRAEDAKDANLPLMYWWAAEPALSENTEMAIALLSSCKIPLLRQFISRRVASGSSLSR